MVNREKSLATRQANKSQNDDDNCSVICYKDPDDGHVGVVRIRQQAICSACNLLRGTLSSYYKHIVDNTHRENVKKLCDENRFIPSVYDQAIHLAFQNNFYYQSEKFHFLYKHTNNEEVDASSQKLDSLEINNNQQETTPRKRRNLQVTLVFQEKTYSQTGIADARIREQLLKDMLVDRAGDLAALPMEIYYNKKKIASEHIHHNAHKGSVVLTTIKDQSHVMLKEQQQEPFENGQMSSVENSREDNGVEQTTAITTQEISTAEILDQNEQSSFVDDDIVCKTVLNNILRDVYSQSEQFKREQRFLSGLARRRFRKKNIFFCDSCDQFLNSEKNGSLHLNSSEHLEKVQHYQTNFLPWRRAMQKSLIAGKPLKDIMEKNAYDDYKATMTLYLAPNNLCNRGRFCCAYCETLFTDQWSLEKHLHSAEHKEQQTSADHKELVVCFANGVNFPVVFKFNGITQLSEIPNDIKTRYQWRQITRAQLDDDSNAFSRNYPFDTFEGATRILSGRAARKQKSFPEKSIGQTTRGNHQHARRNGFNQGRGLYTPTARRGTANKRPFQATAPSNKRFRADLNQSFPGANHTSGPIRNYNMGQRNYNRSGPYNNGNNQWSSRHPNDQQQGRQEVFERSNFELRSLASDNNRYYDDRSAYPMSGGHDYNPNRPPHFNNNGRGFDNQQSNYDPNLIHTGAQTRGDYYPEPSPSFLVAPPYRPPPPRAHSNTAPMNEQMHHIPNNHPRQPTMPLMGTIRHQNQNSSFDGFRVNNNNNNNHSLFFSSPTNQQPSPIGTNSPSMHSNADYRSSSSLPNHNPHSSMYSPMTNSQNAVIPQTRTFDEFDLGSLAQSTPSSYGHGGGGAGGSFRNEKAHYDNFERRNQIQPAAQTSWRGSSRGGNNVRGRGGGATGSFPTGKQPGATFSYSSSNNNNKNNTFSMRGRGAGRNARNFGSGR